MNMLSGDKLIAQAKKINYDQFKAIDARGLSEGILLM